MQYNTAITEINTVIEDIRNHDSLLIYRDIGGVGDAVMITGAIAGLKRQLPDVKIIMATIPYCVPVFINNPNVDYIIDSSQFDRIHADGAVDYGSGKEICKVLFERNGSMFIGLSHQCPSAVYESSVEPKIIKSRQELFSEACGTSFIKGDCRIYVTEEEIAFAKRTIPFKNYIVIHSKSNAKSRNLPNYHVDTLINKLTKRFPNSGVVVLSHDWKWKHKKNEQVIRVIESPLRAIIAIIANADLLIGVDSMGCHVAGACGVPTYGIFGTVDPRTRLSAYHNATWYKGYNRCKRQPCWYHPCYFNFCMRSISMNDVADDIVWFSKMAGLIGGVK